MRELHDKAGRDSADAHPDALAQPAARDTVWIRPIPDAATRIAKTLEYRKKVDTVYAAYAAEQRTGKAPDAHAEIPASESADKPASRIAERREPAEHQEEKKRRPERSRLPSNETTQVAVGIGVVVTSVVDALNVMPGKWDAVAASAFGAVVAGVAWGNERWKDKHGD